MKLMKTLLTLALTLLTTPAFAGYFEVGANGSYKQSFIDESSWQTTTMYSGSLAWYFGRMSAIEGSYTYGVQQAYLHFADRPDQTTTSHFELAGLDLIITMAPQDAFIRPYVKGGAAYLIRKTIEVESGGISSTVAQGIGVVPNAGAGFKLSITKEFDIKIGADAWSSSPGKMDRWDFQWRAGISWML